MKNQGELLAGVDFYPTFLGFSPQDFAGAFSARNRPIWRDFEIRS